MRHSTDTQQHLNFRSWSVAGVKWSLCSQHLSQLKHDSWGLDCCYGNPIHPPNPPPPSAWKCPRLLIWDYTSPLPSLCVNKSTFVLFCPVSKGVYCEWKMARGALRCLTVLSSALQPENFLEWAPAKRAPDGDRNKCLLKCLSYFYIFTVLKQNQLLLFCKLKYIDP